MPSRAEAAVNFPPFNLPPDMKKQCLGLSLAVWILSSTLFAQESPSADGEKRQTAQTFEVKIDLDYLLFLPRGYDADADKKWPLLVFLHGAGERGSDISKVKVHGPPKLVESDPDFPFVVISPQCPKDAFWNTGHLLALITRTIKEHNVDPDRVYLTGLSMGGFGSWALAAEAPEMFAAVAPICGGGDPRMAKKLVDIPIWVFHGDADRVVAISGSQRMVDAIKAAGGTNVEFTIYEGVGHDSWTETYGNEELYEWFLKHKR
ncbi:MAG: prolyl oligopeptidase family serine peptidase [Planctomycetota bacterium]